MRWTLPFDRARALRDAGETVRLALPLIVGQLSGVGMNLVDALLAGHVNAHTLGAVAVGASIWTLAYVVGLGVMMALPPSVAQLVGAERRDAIGPLFRQALWLAAALGILLFFAVRYGGPRLLDVIGVDPALRDDTTAFLHAIAWATPALATYFALRGVSEGMGLTRPTMYFGTLGLLLLAPLGWALMYGKFGLAPLGARGCGIATALVIWLQCLGFLGWLRWRPEYRILNLLGDWQPPQRVAIVGLLRIGLPMGVAIFMEASLFVAVALALGRLGETVVASHQIALNVSALAFMLPLGLALAITVRVGTAAGRGDVRGVRYAGFVGIGLTLLSQSFSGLVMAFGAAWIASLYTNDAGVILLASQLLWLASLFQLPDGIQVASNGALRGLKDTRMPMLITIVAYWGIGMPVGYLLAFAAGFGARGMWMGLIAGLACAAVLLFLRFRRLGRHGRWHLPAA
ncbi:MAG: MATE family efflux transporter [Tahibacter sp.]